MYNSQYYTCEQIDQRLLQGYLDDYNSQNGTNLTKSEFLGLLYNTIGRNNLIDSLVTQVGYFECSTPAGTAGKTITIANYNLFAGGSMKVKFVNSNTANNVNLNINSQGALYQGALYYQGRRASSTNSWDEGEVVEVYYDGTSFYANNVTGGSGDGAFDISVYNAINGEPAVYTDLADALGASGANVPASKRKGGMTVKYIERVDENTSRYVQYRLIATAWSIIVSDWQGVTNEVKAGSRDLVESGGVDKVIKINKMFTGAFGDFILAFPVKESTRLDVTFDVSGLAISNQEIRARLNTDLIDANGVSLYFNGGSSESFKNTTYKEFDIDGTLNTIRIERSATGIIGTGIVEIPIHNPINKLDVVDETARLDYFFNKGSYTFSFYTPKANTGLNTSVDLSYLGIKSGSTLALTIQPNGNIDDNGVRLTLGGVSVTLKATSAETVTLTSDLSTVTIIRSGSGILASGRVDITIVTTPEIDKVKSDISDLQDLIEDFNESLFEGSIQLKITPTMQTGYYYNTSGELVEDQGSQYANPIDISQYAGKNVNLTVTLNNAYSGSSRASLVTDQNGTVITYALEKSAITDGTIDFGILPATAKYLKLSFRSTASNIKVLTTKILEQKDYASVVYVDAANGSDDNPGTSTAPLASIAKALAITDADTEVVLIGDITEKVNLKQKSNQRSVTIIGEKGKKNRFILGTKISEATQYGGNVYYAELSSFPSGALVPVFQHEVADASTLITDAERHPLQRGREYRCESTLLLPVDSVQAVVDASLQKYYWDSTANRLYFKIAEGSSLSGNPIIIPNGEQAIYGNDGSVKLTMTNVDVWYGFLYLQLCNNALLSNCSVKFTKSVGGFVWGNAIGVKLIQCEAARVYSGAATTGDGFNAHSTESSDAQARHTTCTMIDCWSHDNNDDGYSDHERCECSIHGGLFEYNGKAGVTPSFGTHLVCYNTLSRRNYNGFYYIGEISGTEGGKYGQMICYGCVAENNSNEFGFGVSGAGNSMMLVSCKSIGNPKGYVAKANTSAVLIDCGSLNDTMVKEQASGATITVNNTTLVE